eukprot:scaffold147139_cov26-Prasinocladus_malaysianus.AAC.1
MFFEPSIAGQRSSYAPWIALEEWVVREVLQACQQHQGMSVLWSRHKVTNGTKAPRVQHFELGHWPFDDHQQYFMI